METIRCLLEQTGLFVPTAALHLRHICTPKSPASYLAYPWKSQSYKVFFFFLKDTWEPIINILYTF